MISSFCLFRGTILSEICAVRSDCGQTTLEDIEVKPMDSIRPTGISLFGEFTDKSVEDEFLADSLRGSARMTAYLALVLGQS